MEFVSTCPLRVASLLWQRSSGAWVQTIVCKATFDLLPGVARLADRQEPPNEHDEYWDDDPARSLYAPSDLAPFKPRADVLLVGHAFAPGKEAVRSLVARLVVGSIDKSIEVFGERVWMPDGTVSEAACFTSMPLAYERAAGGSGTSNPVGIRSGGRPDVQGHARVPNLQSPGLMRDRAAPMAPVCFGPIAPSWPGRSNKLGRLAGSWPDEDWQLRPMPERVDPGYFNTAPLDQQIEELADDTRIVLENLHREHVRLETVLPGVRPRACLEVPGAPAQDVRLRCDTLWIDTVRAICTLVWRGQVPLHHPQQAGRVVIRMEGPLGRAGPGEQAARLGIEHVVDPALVVSTSDPGETLPFAELRPQVLPFAAARTQGDSRDEAGGRRSSVPPDDSALPFQRASTRSPRDEPQPLMGPVISASPWTVPDATLTANPTTNVADVPSPPIVRTAGEMGPAITNAPIGAAAREPALGGALAASNAATGAIAKTDKPAETTPKQVVPAAREKPREVLDLIWYDRAALPRIRRNLAWKKIIAELKPRPSDDDFDGGLPPEQMQAAKDKRDVFGVLARGEVMDMAGIRRAMAMAILDDGSFVPPYVLTAGVLEFPFDEIDTLRAMLIVMAPFVPGDKKLKATVDLVNETLKTPGIRQARGVAARLCAQVKSAFEQGNRDVPAGYLEAHVQPMLLEGRCYEKRVLNGVKRLRAVLSFTDVSIAVPTYLSDELTDDLPMIPSFRARLIVESRKHVDHYDKVDVALTGLALARAT